MARSRSSSKRGIQYGHYRRTPAAKPLRFAKRVQRLVRVAVLPRLVFTFAPRPSPARSFMRLVEDRRTWHPATTSGTRPAGATVRSGRRIVLRAPARPAVLRDPTRSRIGFARPDTVMVCVRRKIRREVLHAKGVAGSSTRQFSRRVRGAFSDVSC